ncbi:hypothetical protein, partial [Xanthovirga aplysinae]|uniref:hypothetical protein n=1 Tax=Xanthovirga aplysinae TaxID=2529853 RepID=UPI0012BCB0F7
MLSQKIAVDIVLFPDKKLSQEIIVLNQNLEGSGKTKIRLNLKNCLPHISLAMGCVDMDNLEIIKGILSKIGKELLPLEIPITRVESSIDNQGKGLTLVVLQKDKKLQELHEEILKGVENYLTTGVKKEMMASQEEIGNSTFHWIDHYLSHHSKENFSPHITVGFGILSKPVRLQNPLILTTSTLGICQLGNHCTCRKVL